MKDTIKKLKEERNIPDSLKEEVKEFGRINRAITNALKKGPKTIPQIADITKLETHKVTFHLMTLLKYGKIEAGDIDDMDEYYFYELKNK